MMSGDIEKGGLVDDENRESLKHNDARDPIESTEGEQTPKAAEETEETVDPNIVWWESDDDPESPYNWPAWKKYVNCGLISFLTFVTPLASSIFAPGIPQLMKDFGSSSNMLAAFVVSVYVLGFAFGPLIFAPLSELYGRAIIFHVTNVCFTCFVVGCALAPTLDTLIAFRFLSGVFGSCTLTNGGGVIADMIAQEKRAVAMSMFSIGPLLGPIIGPVIGGFLVQAKGWRWVFWVLAIVAGATTVTMVAFMRESYAPVLLQRKTERLRKETGNTALRSKLDRGISSMDLFKRTIARPLKLLIFSPICTVFALFMVIVYGYLYLLFTTVPFVFEDTYNFSTSMVGVVYVSMGLGSLIGMFGFSWDSSLEVKKAMEREGVAKPEVRLKLLPVAAIILPVGFFIYGWTAHFETHWMGPIIGLFIIGVGMYPRFYCCCLSVILDSETETDHCGFRFREYHLLHDNQHVPG